MSEKEFQRRVQRIGELVHQFEATTDPTVRATAMELVQLLMQFHRDGVERILDITFRSDEAGQKVIDELGRDPMVSSLLILYGLHPDDLETRLSRAIERARPQMRKRGGDVEIVAINGAGIRLKIQTSDHVCGSTMKGMQEILEREVYDAAPDLVSLVIEGGEGKPASSFVALDSLLGRSDTAPALATD